MSTWVLNEIHRHSKVLSLSLSFLFTYLLIPVHRSLSFSLFCSHICWFPTFSFSLSLSLSLSLILSTFPYTYICSSFKSQFCSSVIFRPLRGFVTLKNNFSAEQKNVTWIPSSLSVVRLSFLTNFDNSASEFDFLPIRFTFIGTNWDGRIALKYVNQSMIQASTSTVN